MRFLLPVPRSFHALRSIAARSGMRKEAPFQKIRSVWRLPKPLVLSIHVMASGSRR
jgi:hypothetical protein